MKKDIVYTTEWFENSCLLAEQQEKYCLLVLKSDAFSQ